MNSCWSIFQFDSTKNKFYARKFQSADKGNSQENSKSASSFKVISAVKQTSNIGFSYIFIHSDIGGNEEAAENVALGRFITENNTTRDIHDG